MKKINLILLFFASLVLFNGCKDDESLHFGEEAFGPDSVFPYVSIQDRNEDLEDISGNNFWNFTLTPENEGSQVRIDYSTQDGNIVSHDIIVGLDDSESPPADGVVLRTLTSFPQEIIITKEEVATALGISIEELESNSFIYFGGRSTDEDGNIIENDERFEAFLTSERHAYFYQWPL